MSSLVLLSSSCIEYKKHFKDSFPLLDFLGRILSTLEKPQTNNLKYVVILILKHDILSLLKTIQIKAFIIFSIL